MDSSERSCKNLSYLLAYLQWFASYGRKTGEQDDLTASAVPKGSSYLYLGHEIEKASHVNI